LVEEDGDFHNAEDSKHVHHGFEKEKLINQLETISFKFVDYQIFHHIERVVENGSVKNFPMFLLIVQK
jgi:2-hydroxy-3-keto-5-methylthiopentenyl-1-phosphate phosphatase